MSQHLHRLTAAAALALFSLPALAERPEYSFVDIGYQRVDLDVFNQSVDGDAYTLGGSFELGDSWQAFAGYGKAEFDFDVDLDEYSIGGGFHGSLSPTSDFVLNVAYIRAELSNRFASADDDGFGVSVGMRNRIRPNVELAGFVNYVDVGDDEYSFTGRAWYFLTEQFAVGATLGIGDDVTRYGIAGRLFFGR